LLDQARGNLPSGRIKTLANDEAGTSADQEGFMPLWLP
jgi:hypothetical protein